MATEIENQFFDIFGIKGKYVSHFDELYLVDHYIKEYPKITDRILLELICIHNIYLGTNLYSLDYKSLKEEILKDLISEQELRELKKDCVSDDMLHQVQALFGEGR